MLMQVVPLVLLWLWILPATYTQTTLHTSFFDGYYQTINTASFTDPTWTYTSNSNAPQNPVALLNLKQTFANANDLSGNIEADYKVHGFEDLHIHASLGSQYTDSHQSDDISRILSLTTTTAIMASHAIISTIS